MFQKIQIYLKKYLEKKEQQKSQKENLKSLGLQDQFSFDDFRHEVSAENRKLKITLIFTIITSLVILILFQGRDTYLVSSYKKIFPSKIYFEDICQASFENLFSVTPSEHLLHKSIVADLEKTPMDFEITNVLKVFKIEERICQVVVKTDSALRSFIIQFDENLSYPFLYKLISAEEVAVIEYFTKGLTKE